MTSISNSISNTSQINTLGKRKTGDDHVHPDNKKTKKKEFNFIYDQYTEARGVPKMLELTCTKCHAWVLDYQKDGPGNLLRLYLDRIYHPRVLRESTFTQQTLYSAADLKCKECSTILGKPIIYKRRFPAPEVRPAYLLIKDNQTSRMQQKIREE